MSISFINKKLIKPIAHTASQNAFSFLHQPVKPQPRMDGPLFNQIASHLKHTAAYHGLISLSAPQIMFKNRIFVILKKPLVAYSKWTGYQNLFLNQKPQDCYDTIVNPDLVGHSNFKIKGNQQCPSVNGFKFKVWVPLTNLMSFVKYSQKIEKSKLKPVFDHCEQQLTGFYGRVFDHEYRHLEGMMVNISQVCNHQIFLTDESKQNPQNFIVLRNERLERQYFASDNLEKSLKKQFGMEQNQKSSVKQKQKKGMFSQTIIPNQIPDKIDPKLKQRLLKSYEKGKNKQIGDLKQEKLQKKVQNMKQSKNRQNIDSKIQKQKKQKPGSGR